MSATELVVTVVLSIPIIIVAYAAVFERGK